MDVHPQNITVKIIKAGNPRILEEGITAFCNQLTRAKRVVDVKLAVADSQLVALIIYE